MKGLILVAFIFISIALGHELYTGEALTRTGTGALEDDPFRYSLKVIFHSLIWLVLFILLILPSKYLKPLNEWLKSFDSKYNK